MFSQLSNKIYFILILLSFNCTIVYGENCSVSFQQTCYLGTSVWCCSGMTQCGSEVSIYIQITEEQTMTLRNQVSPDKHDELTEVIADQASKANPSNTNSVSAVNSTFEAQLQQQNITDDTNAQSDIEIMKNIIERSKVADRRRWLYLFIACIPSLIIIYIGGTAISLGCITGFIFIWAICYGVKHYWIGTDYELLQNSVRFVIKLEGEQWTQYVNYLYGPNRTGFRYVGAIGALTFCCCRSPHYRQLIDRGYGYIVVCENGFLFDEMFCVIRNDTHVIMKVTRVLGIGFRVYVLRVDSSTLVNNFDSDATRAKKVVSAILQQTVSLDIYLPDTLLEETTIAVGLLLQHGK
ncbi:hypothetical protein I4U23_022340 [Adineta vaga]|nr:hypothetical protein I4U23_022340 [Adineta vaga]